MPPSKSAAPHDTLQAAGAYFEEIDHSRSIFRKTYVGHRQTLFETLVDESLEQPRGTGSAGLVTQQKAPIIGDVLQGYKWLAHGNTSMSSGINLELANEFSLDHLDSELEPEETVPGSLEVEEVLLQGAAGNSREGLAGVDATSSELSERGRVETGDWTLSSSRYSSETMDNEGENERPGYESISKSMEWDEVFRRVPTAAWLPESQSASKESFRRSGVSSTASIDSMSDEAISERAAAWGNGVAKMVLRNSSKETTPRTSYGTAADSRGHTQVIPQVSKYIKDVLSSFQLAFMVCDAINPDGPILYASAGFFRMTGYSAEDVIGRSCHFLQGVDTDTNEVARIRNALKKGEAYAGTLLNYKKDGTPFWNLLSLSPIRDDKGKVIKYIGMQAEENCMRFDQWNVPRSASRSLQITDVPLELSPRSNNDPEDGIPIFSLSTSKLTTAHDPQGRSTASNRYSLTTGRNRPAESCSEIPGQGSNRYSLTIRRSTTHSIGSLPSIPHRDDDRYSFTVRRCHSIELGQRPGESGFSGSQPLIWHLAAERRSENKPGLGFSSLVEETPETTAREEFEAGTTKRIGRVAVRFLRLLVRHLDHRKQSSRQFQQSPAASKRYDSEAEATGEVDEMPRFGSTMIDKSFSEPNNLSSNSMRYISSKSKGPSSDLISSAEAIANSIILDLRARSSRFSSIATSDLVNRRQFCIVHT